MSNPPDWNEFVSEIDTMIGSLNRIDRGKMVVAIMQAVVRHAKADNSRGDFMGFRAGDISIIVGTASVVPLIEHLKDVAIRHIHRHGEVGATSIIDIDQPDRSASKGSL